MKEILKTLLFVGVFPMFMGLFGIFSGKMDEFLFGLALVGPFPLVLFFLLALISKDKSYDFNAVREWRTSIQTQGVVYGGGLQGAMANAAEASRAAQNTGLFLLVKDIEDPEWHIKIRNKKVLSKWYEILHQELNERTS